MKKLGFGLMRLPLLGGEDPDRIDIEQTKEMVDRFLKRGFTYFDTAWMYCKGKSEEATKEALVDRHPRESYTLATKLHAGYVNCLEDRDRIFNEQLRRTGAGYFDYYLIHAVSRELYDKYTKYDCFEWLKSKKQAGLVKHIGFSFHDSADFLDRVLTEHPEVEFVQLQINYLDWDNDGIQSRLCYETAVRHGVPVIVMEPVKGGTLAKLPPRAERILKEIHPDWSIPSWAIRFAASLDNVFMVLSGMSNTAQLDDNTQYMESFEKLTEEELAAIRRVVDILNASSAIACTGCSYCTDRCPMSIPIPTYFSLYNVDLQEAEDKDWKPQEAYYTNLMMGEGKATACIECGQCEQVCPQHLPIIKDLKKVVTYFEGM